MIQQDQQIIFLNQAKCAVIIKIDEALRTGLMEKKIVVTTRRILIFESLSNLISDVEFQILKKKKGVSNDQKKKQTPPRKRISINQFPQYSISVRERTSKIIIDEEPSCHKFMHKLGLRNFIKSLSGMVILKNIKKSNFQLLSFPSLKDGFRFCKSLICAQAWLEYERYCSEHEIEINNLWVRNLSQLANNEKSVILIDPQIFKVGNKKEINSFIMLFDQIPFAHTFQHRYSIVNAEATGYALDFIEAFQDKTHSLILSKTNLTNMTLPLLFPSRVSLNLLMHLDISQNKLTDQIFPILQRLCKEGKKFSYINLSHNQITLSNSSFIWGLLKSAHVALNLHLDHNDISDASIDTIEKYIIFPQNPPLEQINLSFNKFSKKGAWRLFTGNKKYYRYHSYMRFLVYPIPFNKDTFPYAQQSIEYPKVGRMINFNVHSALVEQFEEQSILNQTLHFFLPSKNGDTIRFCRKIPEGVRLPKSKTEVQTIHDLANRIQNFIYNPQFVENMYEMADEISKFEFNLPPISKHHYIKFLSDRLNEALFIRDHYAVRYIRMSLDALQVDYEGYRPRLDKLQLRNEIVKKKFVNILNLEVDQMDINKLLDEMTREGLRLYLCNTGVQLIYYLKYLRDQWVEKLLLRKYNPQNFINKKIAQNNLNLDEDVSEKDIVVPYEIKVQKKIDQNFYLHPWKANYVILSETTKKMYQQCLKYLQNNTKRERFAIYFDRIEERILFMLNQFTLFSSNNFKHSYDDLKINCARLLSIYRFIQDRNLYLQIPSITRKVPINKQKIITVKNEKRFSKEYHISKYPNLCEDAKKKGFYNYTGKFTKYQEDLFDMELKRLKQHMNIMFTIIEKQVRVNSKRIPQQCIQKFKEVVKNIRQAVYPQQLKEQFYLRVLSWRNGKYMNNTEVLQYISFFTFYLRPPLQIEKYIVASVIQNQNLNLQDLPMCLVSDINKATQTSVKGQEEDYIERDWMAIDEKMVELMHKKGKITIQIQLLTKEKISITTKQSNTIREIVHQLTSVLQDRVDIEHYWLYTGYIGQKNLRTLEQSEYLGELMQSAKDSKPRFFVFRRRIYSPQWRYIYKKESQFLINQLYYDVKYQYLFGDFFLNDQIMIEMAAEMLIIDTMYEAEEKKIKFTDIMQDKIKNMAKIYKAYMPQQAIKRSFMQKQAIVNNMKNTVNEKVMKKEHLKITQLKLKMLQKFQDYPEFMSSNYMFSDRNKSSLKVSFNIFDIIVESEDDIEKVRMEQIISIIPKSKFLLINYHHQEGINGKLSLFSSQNQIIAAAQDLLTYCVLRIRMMSPSLYGMYRYMNLVKIKAENKGKLPREKQQLMKNTLKKLSNLNLTILDLKNIPYYNENRYIKVHTNRKLYANASQQILQMDNQEQQNLSENHLNNNDSFQQTKLHNAFSTIFPKVLKQTFKSGIGIIEPKKSYNAQFDAIPDILPIKNSNKDDDPNPQPDNPTTKKNVNKAQRLPPDDQFEPITTAKKDKPSRAPKGNR